MHEGESSESRQDRIDIYVRVFCGMRAVCQENVRESELRRNLNQSFPKEVRSIELAIFVANAQFSKRKTSRTWLHSISITSYEANRNIIADAMQV